MLARSIDLFVKFDSFPNQQFFSDVGMGICGLNLY